MQSQAAAKPAAKAPASMTDKLNGVSAYNDQKQSVMLDSDVIGECLMVTQIDNGLVSGDVYVKSGKRKEPEIQLGKKKSAELEKRTGEINGNAKLSQKQKDKAIQAAKDEFDNEARDVLAGKYLDEIYEAFNAVPSACTWEFSHFEAVNRKNGNNPPLTLTQVARFNHVMKDAKNPIAQVQIMPQLVKFFEQSLRLCKILFKSKGEVLGIAKLEDFQAKCVLCVGQMVTNDAANPVFIPPMFVFNTLVGDARIVVPLFSWASNLRQVHFKFVSAPMSQMGLAHFVRIAGKPEQSENVAAICKELMGKNEQLLDYAGLLDEENRISWVVTDSVEEKIKCFIKVVGPVMHYQGKPSGKTSNLFVQVKALWSLHEFATIDKQSLFVPAWNRKATKPTVPKEKSAGGSEKSAGSSGSKKSKKADDGERPRKVVKPESKKITEDMRNQLKTAKQLEAAEKMEKWVKSQIQHNLDKFNEMMSIVIQSMKKEGMVFPKKEEEEMIETARAKFDVAMRAKIQAKKAWTGVNLSNGRHLTKAALAQGVARDTLDVSTVPGWQALPIVPTDFEIFLEHKAEFKGAVAFVQCSLVNKEMVQKVEKRAMDKAKVAADAAKEAKASMKVEEYEAMKKGLYEKFLKPAMDKLKLGDPDEERREVMIAEAAVAKTLLTQAADVQAALDEKKKTKAPRVRTAKKVDSDAKKVDSDAKKADSAAKLTKGGKKRIVHSKVPVIDSSDEEEVEKVVAEPAQKKAKVVAAEKVVAAPALKKAKAVAVASSLEEFLAQATAVWNAQQAAAQEARKAAAKAAKAVAKAAESDDEDDDDKSSRDDGESVCGGVARTEANGKEGDNLPGDIQSTCGSEHPSEDDGEEEEEEGSGSDQGDDDDEDDDEDEEEDDKPIPRPLAKPQPAPLTRRPTGFPPQHGGGKGLASREGKVVPVGDAMEVDQAEEAVGPSKSAAPVSTRPPAAAAAKPVASTKPVAAAAAAKPVAAAAAAKPVATTKQVVAAPLPLIPRLATNAPVSLLGGVRPIPVETTAVVTTLSVGSPPPAPVIDADAMEVGNGWSSTDWPAPTTSNLSLLAGAAGGSYCPTSPNSWHESQQAQRFNFGPWAGEEDQGGDSLFPGLRQALNEVAAGPAAPPPPADR